MPIALGIMQTGRISVYNTVTTFFSLTPISGSTFCDNAISFVINVQNITSPFHSTLVGIGSNGVALPTGTISVTSTAGFPPAGQIFIGSINTLVSYTGITSNTFTGCTGGSGTLITSQAVTSGPFPPQGAVYIQDLTTNTILVGGIGSLAVVNSSNSRVTLTPNIPIGSHDLVAFYVGQDGNTYDIFHQFKPSQSAVTPYPVARVTTATSINGPGSFGHASSPNYSMTVFPNSPPSPSVGTVTLTGQQGAGPIVTIGSSSLVAGSATIGIPSNTFVAGSLTLTASYIDSVNECYGASVGILAVTVS